MTRGTNDKVKEGMIAHRGGIRSDSKTRVKSDGLVNVMTNENPKAPLTSRRNTPRALIGPENNHVVPVTKIKRGAIPHRRLRIPLNPPTKRNSIQIKHTRMAKRTGSKIRSKIN